MYPGAMRSHGERVIPPDPRFELVGELDIATARHRAEHAAMPAEERRFARGWVRMVDLFSAAGWRTDLQRRAETGAGDLPSRVLADGAPALTNQRRARCGRCSRSPIARRGAGRSTVRSGGG